MGFTTAAKALIEAKRPGWRNAKHAAQWSSALEEAGERLFTFVRYPPGQWRSLHHECGRASARGSSGGASRPSACCPVPRPPPCCSRALLASGQITMRRVRRLADPGALTRRPVDLAACSRPPCSPGDLRRRNFHHLRDTTFSIPSAASTISLARIGISRPGSGIILSPRTRAPRSSVSIAVTVAFRRARAPQGGRPRWRARDPAGQRVRLWRRTASAALR